MSVCQCVRVELCHCVCCLDGGQEHHGSEEEAMGREPAGMVMDALVMARGVRPLRVCTCGAPEWKGGLCGHCQLVAAERALWKLRMRGLIQEKLLELLRDPGKRRAIARRRLEDAIARAVAQAPASCGEVAEEVLEALMDVVPARENRRTAEMLREAVEDALVQVSDGA